MDEKKLPPNPDAVGAPADDEKVACETSIPADNNRPPMDSRRLLSELGAPADSYLLPKQEEREWMERVSNLPRAQSVKGGSQRLAIKTNPSILGLPKLQRCVYTGSCALRPPSHRRARFFPGQARKGNGRVVLLESEPASPKVSCIGSLDLKGKEKHRRRKKAAPSSPVVRGGGFLRMLGTMLCRGKQAVDCAEPAVAAVEPRRKGEFQAAVAPEEMVEEAATTTTVAPPGLGSMKNFTSRRKSASDIGFLDFDDVETESGMKYEMDLHVSTARPDGRGRTAVVSPFG